MHPFWSHCALHRAWLVLGLACLWSLHAASSHAAPTAPPPAGLTLSGSLTRSANPAPPTGDSGPKTAASATADHPFHRSEAEAAINPENGHLEVSLRVDSVELEAALRVFSGQPLSLDRPSECEAALEAYVRDCCQVKTRWSAAPAPTPIATRALVNPPASDTIKTPPEPAVPHTQPSPDTRPVPHTDALPEKRPVPHTNQSSSRQQVPHTQSPPSAQPGPQTGPAPANPRRPGATAGWASLEWVGYELEGLDAWLYFEFTLPADGDFLDWGNALLCERHPFQENLAILTDRRGQRQSLRTTPDAPWTSPQNFHWRPNQTTPHQPLWTTQPPPRPTPKPGGPPRANPGGVSCCLGKPGGAPETSLPLPGCRE